MKRFGDFLLNTPAAAAALGVSLVCLILFLIPALHEAAWIIGIIAVLVFVGSLLLVARQWWADQQRIDRLNAEIADASRAYAPVALASPPADAEEEVPADTVCARRILDLLPKDSGLVPHMRIANGFTALDPALLDPLRTFLKEFKQTSFSDQRVHTAFMDVYRAGQSFDTWVQAETYIADADLEIRPGDIREGGWHEFGRARVAGEERMDALLESLRTFERTALETRVV